MSIYRIEIKRRLVSHEEPVKAVNATVINRYVKDKFYKPEDMWREKAIALFTDKANNITGYVKVSVNGSDKCVIDKKIIAAAAVKAMASSVILVHNHPSGNPMPSSSDIIQTNDLKRGLSCLDIKLLDHVIITDKSFYSFMEEKTFNA